MNRLKKIFLLITAISLSFTIVTGSIYASKDGVSPIWKQDPVQRILQSRDNIINGTPYMYTAEHLVNKMWNSYEKKSHSQPYDEKIFDPIIIGGNDASGKIEGKITSVDPLSGTIIVEKSDGTSSIIKIGRGTSILKNGKEGTLRDIEEFDKIYAQLLPDLSWSIEAETPESKKTTPSSEGESVLERIMAEGLLTAEQLNALAMGDLEGVAEGLKRNVYNRLLTDGVNPAEAEAIITQDWNSLAEFSKTRLASAISDELGISKEMVTALMNQDWKNARAYAQIEAANYLISYLLKASTS